MIETIFCRKFFPSGGSNFSVWINKVEKIINYLPTLNVAKEVHIMSISRLPHPPKFFLSLLLETCTDPDKLSLRLDIVDRSRELEQLHEGCYVDHIYLYGGNVKENELVGSVDEGELWHDIGMVKFTPMETSRMKAARVVQVPLHTRCAVIFFVKFIYTTRL